MAPTARGVRAEAMYYLVHVVRAVVEVALPGLVGQELLLALRIEQTLHLHTLSKTAHFSIITVTKKQNSMFDHT